MCRRECNLKNEGDYVMNPIPRIETERLLLRPMEMADWPAYFEMMQSERSVGMGGPFDLREAWGMFCHDTALWILMGHGALMFEERTTGQCLGQVGLNQGPLFPEHELGWFVYPHAEGKSYAFEAACAIRDWAFCELGIPTLVTYLSKDNVRSRRLAERLGAVLDHDAPRHDPADLVYRHPNPGCKPG